MNEIVLSSEQQEIAAQKRTSWAQMGEVVYKAELQLKGGAQAALMNITLPTKIEDVPQAETVLKNIKAAQKDIEGKRKEITSRFDDVTKRLMEPEKSFTDVIKTLSDSIIQVKKEYEAEQRKKQQIVDEAAQIRNHYRNEKTRIDSELKLKVNNLVNRCYEKAFEKNVEPDEVEAYLNASKEAVKEQHFAFNLTKANWVMFDENKALNENLHAEVMKTDLDACVETFKKEIDFKFSDYETAFANKAEALKQAAEEERRREEQIMQEKQQAELAAKLEASATPVTVTPVFTKALKKSYEVDMPETVESFFKINAAFSANLNVCLPKLKVTKWFSFTAAQAAAVLGKVKSDDNQFQPSNIIFKEVDKL